MFSFPLFLLLSSCLASTFLHFLFLYHRPPTSYSPFSILLVLSPSNTLHFTVLFADTANNRVAAVHRYIVASTGILYSMQIAQWYEENRSSSSDLKQQQHEAHFRCFVQVIFCRRKKRLNAKCAFIGCFCIEWLFRCTALVSPSIRLLREVVLVGSGNFGKCVRTSYIHNSMCVMRDGVALEE